jgi:hypothetical protein
LKIKENREEIVKKPSKNVENKAVLMYWKVILVLLLVICQFQWITVSTMAYISAQSGTDCRGLRLVFIVKFLKNLNEIARLSCSVS